jgi:glutathione S-transferase
MNWILHHYDFSNFSEKVRLMLGFKEVTWDSVEIPSYSPKPDYTPLTGGYRRTPSLQIGADVYCDTRLIADVIESHCPQPSYYGGSPRARVLARSIAEWTESRMLWPTALYITGINADRFSEGFHNDRAVLHGKPRPDIAKVKASAVKFLAQMRSELATIEDLFVDGSPYVLGQDLSLADIALYQVPWFLDVIEPGHHFLDDMPRTREWMIRVAAVGHGTRRPLDPAAAIERANAAMPKAIERADLAVPEGLALGDAVSVRPLDENSPAFGKLAYADDKQISITVMNESVNEVRVHFPRSGYRLSRDRNT